MRKRSWVCESDGCSVGGANPPSLDRTMPVDLPWHTGRKSCGRSGWVQTEATLAALRWGPATSLKGKSCLSCFTASRGKLLSPTWTSRAGKHQNLRALSLKVSEQNPGSRRKESTKGNRAHLDLHGCRAAHTQQQRQRDAGSSHGEVIQVPPQPPSAPPAPTLPLITSWLSDQWRIDTRASLEPA